MDQAKRKTTVAGRAAERVKLQGRAHLALAGDIDQLPLEVQLEDISFNGAGLRSSIPLPVGAQIVLLLHPLNGSRGSIRGRVLNSRPVDENDFRIGMEFDTTDGPTLKCIRQAFYPDDALL